MNMMFDLLPIAEFMSACMSGGGRERGEEEGIYNLCIHTKLVYQP